MWGRRVRVFGGKGNGESWRFIVGMLLGMSVVSSRRDFLNFLFYIKC